MSERLLITQVQRDTEKNHAHLYGRGHQWPDLRLFDLSDLHDVDIQPEDLEPGELVSCRFWAHYTLSDKLNSKGNPYRDIIALEPISAPATSTSTDTSAIVDELRAIRALLHQTLTDAGFTVSPVSALDPQPQNHGAHAANPPTDDEQAEIVKTATADPPTDDETGEVPGPVVLLYGDGSQVSDNPHETDAFQQFVRAQNELPTNLASLRNWSRIANAETDAA